MGDLNGRLAIVTGAGNEDGIGFQSARKMALKGADLVITDIAAMEPQLRDRAAELIEDAAVEVLGFTCDVTEEAEIERTIRQTLEQFGRIDILFNNAGIGHDRAFVDSTLEFWDLNYRVNLRGVVAMTQAVLPTMRKQQRGVIINTSSTAGVYGTDGTSAYGAMKAGVINLTKVLAVELGPENIRVLTVCPGLIDTQMWRQGLLEKGVAEEDVEAEIEKRTTNVCLRRWGTAEDVANFVAFAASDDASYMTGSYHFVHGGWPSPTLA